MCRIHLFWDVCKGSRRRDGGLFSLSVFCQAIAKLLAKLCHAGWQNFATLLANYCHPIGKALPLNRQDFAT